jgi:hypothetical protein
MIPTMILVGLVFGRWWRSTLIAAAVLWPALVAWTAGPVTVGQLIGASLLGVANAAVGVLVHQALLRLVRRGRQGRPV